MVVFGKRSGLRPVENAYFVLVALKKLVLGMGQIGGQEIHYFSECGDGNCVFVWFYHFLVILYMSGSGLWRGWMQVP